MTVLHLPYPPSLWKLYYGHGKSRRKSTAYQKWINAAGWQLKLQKPKAHSGTIAISYFATKPDKRGRDLDNLTKPILDLLVTHQVIKDDSLIGVLHCAWRKEGTGVTVVIEDL